MKFFEEYQRAGERISAEATEYVRGIPVVKVFQQTVYSFKSFHAAILSYRDLASGYAMMCRMPYTLLTVVLNAMFLLLMPLGMVLIGGAADGWAVLADLVFYIFFAPQLAFMMERLMYAVNAQMEAAEAVNKLEAILKESPLPEPAADSGSKPADSGISFENVTFSYDGADRPALTNVSFHHAAGGGVGAGGPLRRRQDHHRPADPALFRCAGRGGAPGRTGCAKHPHRGADGADLLCLSGGAPV